MSSGFNPMSMFKPTGNIVVQEKLKNLQTQIEDLLIEESFLTEFRKPNHQPLQKYMSYSKYKSLVNYITRVGDPNDKNKSFKFPFICAQILSIDNQHTYKFFVSDKPILQQIITFQQIEVQKQNESDQSCISNRSSQSIISDQSQAENQSSKDNLEDFDIQSLPQTYIQKNPSQINQDDFPLVQQTKKIKVKEKTKIIKKIQHKPLIQNLFEYFAQPINHILTGYVCKTLNSLLSKNNINLKYFIKNRRQNILKHIESRSVEDLIIRICTIQNQTNLKDQIQFLNFLIQSMIYTEDIQHIQNIGFLLSEILKKVGQQFKNSSFMKKMLSELIKSQIFRRLIKRFGECIQRQKQISTLQNCSNQKQQLNVLQFRVKQLLKVIQEFIELLIITKALQSESFVEFQDELNQLTQNICNKLQMYCQQKIYKKEPATIKITLVTILFKMISENMAFSQQILSDRDQFYEWLFKLVKKHPNNNILHNEIFKIFQYVISSIQSINSVKANFVSGKLLKKILQIKEQKGLLYFILQVSKFASNQNINYQGHAMKLALGIDSIKSKESQYLNDFKLTNQWKQISSHFLEPRKELLKTNLGNYIKKREVCSSVSFQKQQILIKYQHFLNGAKFMELDQFDNFEPTDSDSSHDQAQTKERLKEIQQMQNQQCELNTKLAKEEQA